MGLHCWGLLGLVNLYTSVKCGSGRQKDEALEQMAGESNRRESTAMETETEWGVESSVRGRLHKDSRRM